MRLVFICIIFSVFLVSCEDVKVTRELNGMQFSEYKMKNGLKVTLVSHDEFKKSAAALAVGVGQFDDPADKGGLAHYLEHMLFMGTKKYPEHDEYSNFINTHGGYNNAYTAGRFTNYFFQIDNDYFTQGLDRFAQFFIQPLFNEEFLEKEKNAVHSEFERGYKNDGVRSDQVVKNQIKESHPAGAFHIGNNETLKPLSRKDVLSFYNKYYKAQNMVLVVMSPFSLKEMKHQVDETFSRIPRSEFSPKSILSRDFYFKKGSKNLFFVKSLGKAPKLKIVFNIENQSTEEFLMSTPAHVISSLIGDEKKRITTG